MTGSYTLHYLVESCGFGNFFKLRGTNKVIAIYGSMGPMVNIHRVHIVIEKDKPLYKQHMDMMMGKRPTKMVDTKSYFVDKIILSETNAHIRAEVYEVIRCN